MNKKEKTIIWMVGGLLTAGIVYILIRLCMSDMAFSMVPGWHTTIFPHETTLVILAIAILMISLLVYLTFRRTVKLLTTLWTKLK